MKWQAEFIGFKFANWKQVPTALYCSSTLKREICRHKKKLNYWWIYFYKGRYSLFTSFCYWTRGFASTFIVFNFYPFYSLKCQTSIDYISPCALYLSVKLVNFCGEKCKTVPCGQLYRLADWEMDGPKGKVKARLLLSAGWCTKVVFVRYHTLIGIGLRYLKI